MKRNCKIVVAALLVAVLLLTTPLLGCGDDEAEEKTVITIATITDLTGPAGPALVPATWALQDLVRYINEEEPIPGAELKVVVYNDNMDPARSIPGYEWVKEKGAKIIISGLEYHGTVLKPFAERDEVPVCMMVTHESMIEPPGWVFCTQELFRNTATALKWIGDQWDYSQGIPKIGCVTYDSDGGIASEETLREYCQDNPDKFEYVGGNLIPVTSMTVSAGEIEKLKDCDWVGIPVLSGLVQGNFFSEYRGRGYTAKFFGDNTLISFWGYILDKVGWEGIDGSIIAQAAGWWTDPYPIVDLLKELLYEYHPADAEDVIYSGAGYVGAGITQYFFLQILLQAIEDVGPENFDGRAFYNTAVKSKISIEGFPEWGYTETGRVAMHHTKLYEASAEREEIVGISDYLSVAED